MKATFSRGAWVVQIMILRVSVVSDLTVNKLEPYIGH